MITYRFLEKEHISYALFARYNRYQKVSRCWRKEKDGWALKDIPFIENWSIDDLNHLVSCLKQTVLGGGVVIGAFDDDRLVGFSSLESGLFGDKCEYLQLSNLHVSSESRSMSIGKALFGLSAEKAREMGAKKLYMSAHSSEETQAFYKAMGCTEALEYNRRLTDLEPCDCQLEYAL